MEALARRKNGALGYSFLVVQRPCDRQYATFADSRDKLVAVESLRRNTANRQEYVTNAHELFAAARLAREIGCDYFEFKPMVDPTHYLLAFDEPLRRLIGEQHARTLEHETETFKIVAPRSIEYLCQQDDPVEPKTYSQCPAMELRTLVTPSGIYPCPYHRGRDDKRLATLDVVANGSFEEFWTSDARREAMRKTNPSCDCEFYCIRHPTNLALHGLKTLQEAGMALLDHIQEYDGIDDPFF